LFFCGKECRRRPSLIEPTQSLGNGLQMGCTLPSRRMGSNSSGLTAPSILRLSGRQRLRASIDSLDGFYSSKKFRLQTFCWLKEFRVTRCVVSAIKHLKQLLISACIARLLRRFGSWFTLGRGALLYATIGSAGSGLVERCYATSYSTYEAHTCGHSSLHGVEYLE